MGRDGERCEADERVTTSLDALEGELRRLGRVVVAFSGGADSSLLAKVAHDTLGRSAVLCVTALSPSLPGAEEADCRALAAEWDLRWLGVPTSEMEDPAYVANGPDRCARCKTALMTALAPLAAAENATVVLGVNLSDLGDHRPGQRAAAAAGATFPFVGAGFTKADIRHWSRQLGLRTWDKPAAACLASRLPYGTPVTLGRLVAVEKAEAALHALGFGQIARAPPRRRRPARSGGRRAGPGSEAPGRGRGGRAGRGLPFRRAGPRGIPLGQPEPRPGRGRQDRGGGMSQVRVKVKLTFPESEVRRAVLATMVRQFDVEPNIRRADVEEHRGWIVCEIDGEAAAVDASLDWLRTEGITVDLLGDVLEG